MKPGKQSKKTPEELDRRDLEWEEPPDPAAVEGERRSREADPWGVMAFELSVVLKGAQKSIGEGLERLVRSQDQPAGEPPKKSQSRTPRRRRK